MSNVITNHYQPEAGPKGPEPVFWRVDGVSKAVLALRASVETLRAASPADMGQPALSGYIEYTPPPAPVSPDLHVPSTAAYVAEQQALMQQAREQIRVIP